MAVPLSVMFTNLTSDKIILGLRDYVREVVDRKLSIVSGEVMLHLKCGRSRAILV